MKALLYGGLLSAAVVISLSARAQSLGSLPAPAAAPDSLALIKGYGLARITEPNGQTHRVYVPVAEAGGFTRMLPFYRRAEEISRLGQPWSISLDKVQQMQLHGTYYEHLHLRGKDTHLLAARVANGPVELFSYLEQTQLMVPNAAGVGAMSMDGRPNQHWYVRRNGDLQ